MNNFNYSFCDKPLSESCLISREIQECNDDALEKVFYNVDGYGIDEIGLYKFATHHGVHRYVEFHDDEIVKCFQCNKQCQTSYKKIPLCWEHYSKLVNYFYKRADKDFKKKYK